MDRKEETKFVNRIKQLASTGIQGAKLIPPIVDELSKMIPWSSQIYFTLNRENKTIDVFDSHSNLSKVFMLSLNNDDNVDVAGIYRILSEGVAGSDNSCRITEIGNCKSGKPFSSPNLTRLMNKVHLLVGNLNHKNQAIGILCMMRPDRFDDFSNSEKRLFARLLPLISKGIAVQGRDEVSVESDLSGTVLFDSQACVMNSDPIALNLLNRAFPSAGYRINSTPDRSNDEPVPQQVTNLVKEFIEEHERSTSTVDCGKQLTIKDLYGTYKLNLKWLSPYSRRGSSYVTLSIRYQQPLKYLMWKNCQNYGLTQKELEVALLIVDGYVYEDIANRLYVSKYTIIDHAKAIFNKVSIKNRNELANRIIFH